MDTPIAKLPIEERSGLASSLALNDAVSKPDLFLMALDYNLISGSFTICRDGEESVMTLLSVIAGKIAHLIRVNAVEDITIWARIIKDLVAAGADLHANLSPNFFPGYFAGDVKTDGQMTPLTFMLANAISDLWPWRPSPNLDLAMSIWLDALLNSGVDLQVYGKRESLTWANLETCDSWNYDRGHVRLLGFEFGPSPKDWKIWQNEPTDQFAGDFWQMTERRVEVMPGTWIE